MWGCVVVSGMSLLRDDGNSVTFAQLTGAYWLDDVSGDCREGRQDVEPVGADRVVGRWAGRVWSCCRSRWPR